jgi:F420-dependent oxidoreductase-like protein
VLGAAEEWGFDFVFRSDHFTNPNPPDGDSLELWASFVYAASHTTRIEFGSLVTPVTFRHPAITARSAAAVDDLSGGRLVLGIGAGWQEREHRLFGVPFPPTSTRFEMLVDYVEVVRGLLRSDEPVSYDGKHFRLEDAILLPRPARSGGPPILIGGTGERRTMPIAARYADDWNALFVVPERFRELSQHMDGLLKQEGRAPGAVRRSIMLGTMFARDDSALQEWTTGREMTVAQANERGLIVGTPEMWVGQIAAYVNAGAQRIMLQWLDLDDIEGIGIVGRDVLPRVKEVARAG